jgi:hypothetical protein
MYETNLSNEKTDGIYYGPGGYKPMSKEMKQFIQEERYFGPGGFKPAYFQKPAYNPKLCQ